MDEYGLDWLNSGGDYSWLFPQTLAGDYTDYTPSDYSGPVVNINDLYGQFGGVTTPNFTPSPIGTSYPGTVADTLGTWGGNIPSVDVSVYNPMVDNQGAGGGFNMGGALSSLFNALNSPLGMGLLGAGLGSINGSKQSGNTTVTSEPWSAQQPYLIDLFQRAQRAANTSTAANPMETQATGQMQTAASGNLTNPLLGLQNPFIQGQIDQAGADIYRNLQPMRDTAMRQSGSFGNTGVDQTFAKEAASQIGKVAQNMRFNDYTNQQQLNEADVTRRMGAVNNLYQVGRQQRTNAFEPLKNYSDLIRGSYGSTQTTPNFTTPFAGALGGGLLGTQIYKMMQ